MKDAIRNFQAMTVGIDVSNVINYFAINAVIFLNLNTLTQVS